MFEYRPWAHLELKNSYEKYRKGIFSILDIELSGQCNFNCMYCDSPDHTKKCKINIYDIENLLSSCFFEWIFICGLGEPVQKDNYSFLIKILNLCKKYNVKCSIFSNMFVCNKEIIEFVEEGILYILFKYDSNDYKLNANVYGTSNSVAEQQYKNIQILMKHVRCDGNMTNIGASIVPTRLNANKIPEIVEECCENQIYPLLADLENSGRGQDHYSVLSLNSYDMQILKNKVESIIGEKYKIPICPAVISGIHISNESNIVVDEISGLTCPWFWLEEPQLYKISQLNKMVELEEIKARIIDYRNHKLQSVQEIYLSYAPIDFEKFGGCGGDIRSLLKDYIEVQKSLEASSL